MKSLSDFHDFVSIEKVLYIRSSLNESIKKCLLRHKNTRKYFRCLSKVSERIFEYFL